MSVSAARELAQTPAIVRDRFDRFPVLTPGNYDGLDLTGNNDSSSQIKDAVSDARNSRLEIPKGTLIFDDPSGLTISQPTQIDGVGKQFATNIYWTGTGTKSVRTQRIHPSDGIDAPLSAAISVEAANVKISNIYGRCFFTASNLATYGDWGADWDCGIFVKSQPFFSTQNVRFDGFWRKAGLYVDVTQNSGGADFMDLRESWFKGMWGMFVGGPIPQSPNTEAQPGDVRGAGGMSSALFARLILEDAANPILLRRFSDTDGGGLFMDGKIPNPLGRLNKMNFLSSRVISAGPYCRRLEGVAGIKFDDFHGERRTGYQRADNAGGATVVDRISDQAKSISMINTDILNTTKDWADAAVMLDIGGRDISSSTETPRLPRLSLPSISKGNFTPEIRGTTGQVSGTYNAGTFGKWTRGGFDSKTIGYRGYVALTSKTGLNGNIGLTLPFAPAESGPGQSIDGGFITASGGLFLLFSGGSTTALIYRQQSGLNSVPLTQAEMLDTSFLRFNFSYDVA